MINEYENKMIKLNTNLRGLPEGTEVPIQVDAKGTPTDQYWRRRAEDAKTDNCIEFLQSEEPSEEDQDEDNLNNEET